MGVVNGKAGVSRRYPEDQSQSAAAGVVVMRDGEGNEVDQGEREACGGVGLAAVDHKGGKISLWGEVIGLEELFFFVDGVDSTVGKARMGLLTMSSTSK